MIVIMSCDNDEDDDGGMFRFENDVRMELDGWTRCDSSMYLPFCIGYVNLSAIRNGQDFFDEIKFIISLIILGQIATDNTLHNEVRFGFVSASPSTGCRFNKV